MPYSSVTIRQSRRFANAQVKRQFQIEVVTEPFFRALPTLTPGEWLTTLLAKSAPLAVTLAGWFHTRKEKTSSTWLAHKRKA
ncbi:hypothetical protein [Chamaesiphon sp.]|uniref:hypothetical protein n=1 Tax=Chamaesiphon sp. TaxID=2814140 RepID=UPI003593F23F